MVRPVHIALLAMATVLPLRSQSIGVGYGSNQTFLLDCTWTSKRLVYQLGLAAQKSDAVGKKVDERKPNYGLEQLGKGDSYAAVDFGVGFSPSPRTKVVFVASFGQREYYTNYSDLRFNGGGYHMVDHTDFVAGGGVSLHFPVHPRWGLEVGVNSLHGALATIQYRF